MIAALFLAAYLGCDPALVAMVYDAGGIDCVAVVEMESQFNPRAIRREPRGHTSFGLFQLDSEWHDQHRENISAHIATGARILAECPGRTLAEKVSHYNGGKYPGAYSMAWGKRVQAKRDELVRQLGLYWGRRADSDDAALGRSAETREEKT